MAGPKCDADGCKRKATWIRVPRGGWSVRKTWPGAVNMEPKDAEFYCDRHAYDILFAKFNKVVGTATIERS